MNWNFLCKPADASLQAQFFNDIQSLKKEDWKAVTSDENIYLSLPYLEALETAMKDKMSFRYILFYNKEGKPMAAAAVQLLNFSEEGVRYLDRYCSVADKIKNTLIQTFDLKIMVCGNVFACGENGFMHTADITADEAYRNLSQGLYELRQEEKSKGRVSVVLLKEFWPGSFKNSDLLKTSGFKDFSVDVNMVLKIHSTWHSMEEYLASMTTKFRTKAKGVYKKSADLQVRDLDAEEIRTHISDIEKLYFSVVEKADFKFGVMDGKTFVQLKEGLHDDFVFKAYFLADKMVGFSTSFISNGNIDANYVGLDYTVNQEYAVYQRMLYDFVELAIQKGATELRLGRTAEEIKSCIGAEPTDMKLYIKHRNSISNKLLAPIIASISPSEFELRKPFKAAFA